MLRKLDIFVQMNDTRSLYLTIYKNQLKCSWDQNISHNILKFLEETSSGFCNRPILIYLSNLRLNVTYSIRPLNYFLFFFFVPALY